MGPADPAKTRSRRALEWLEAVCVYPGMLAMALALSVLGSSAEPVPGGAGAQPTSAGQPESAAGQPESAAGQPESAAALPESAAALPESAAALPESAAAQLEPAAPDPTPAAPRSAAIPAPPAAGWFQGWYGWRVALADALAWALCLSRSPEDAAVPLLFTGSIVHVVHGNVGRGLASFAVRGAGGLVGAFGGLITASRGENGDDPDFNARAVGGFLVGLAVADLIDIVAIARSPEDGGPKSPGTPLQLAPVVSSLPGGGSLGVAGAF